jgi:ubiquinone/menaquinone biosynthesis C-methylase UbiE
MPELRQYPTGRVEDVKPAFRDGKTEMLAALIRERARVPIRRLLVVGCGSGLEAAILARELGAEVIGIDLQGSFDVAAAAAVDLRRGDATCLEFADGSFDFVFSYHALEHIPAYGKALSEMARVLSKDGAYCVGTPNRLRLFGYLGSKDATWRDKIAWNLADWKARLHGKFRNEYGAHAGFSSGELDASLAEVFDQTDEITLPYYQRVYRQYAGWVSLLEKLGLGRFMFASVYFMGGK